jgi:hypothetical protein
MTYQYTYKHAETTLECELDYSPEELGFLENGLQMVPDSPEEMVLISAKANGMEMYEVLAEWVIEEIESLALEQLGECHV